MPDGSGQHASGKPPSYHVRQRAFMKHVAPKATRAMIVVWEVLQNCAGPDGRTDPPPNVVCLSVTKIADDAGIDRRTATRALRALESVGVIRTVVRGNSRIKSSRRELLIADQSPEHFEASFRERLVARREAREEKIDSGPSCPECRGSGKCFESFYPRIGYREIMCLRCLGLGKIPWDEVRAHECLEEEFEEILKKLGEGT